MQYLHDNIFFHFSPYKKVVPRAPGPLPVRGPPPLHRPERLLPGARERPQARVLRPQLPGQDRHQPLSHHGRVRRLLHRREAVRLAAGPHRILHLQGDIAGFPNLVLLLKFLVWWFGLLRGHCQSSQFIHLNCWIGKALQHWVSQCPAMQ